MSTVFSLLLLIIGSYLVPFLFVIGLIHFIYGFIEYYIVGKGADEGRAQHGREILLKAITWLSIAILAQLVLILLTWISTLSLPDIDTETPHTNSNGIEKKESILKVPNVPTR